MFLGKSLLDPIIFFCRVPCLKLCVQWKLLSRHRQNDQQGHPTGQPALGQSTSQRVLEWSAFRSSKWPHEKCTSSVFEKRKDSSGMGAWGNIHPSTQMSAQQKLTSTWNYCFLGRSEVATFWKANVESQPFRLDLPSNIIQKISGNLSP